MFTDYQARVVEFYMKKRDSGELSINLVHPTAGKIKKECQLIFQLRHSREDIAILSQFLGYRETRTEYERAIKAFETEKFKPLAQFLKKGGGKTEEKNIELLAWLIDFSPRPYRFESDYQQPQKTETGNSIPEDFVDINDAESADISGGSSFHTVLQNTSVKTGKPLYKKPSVSFRGSKLKRNVLIAAAFLIGAAMLIFFNTKTKQTSVLTIFSDEDCMYWAEDHYVQAACSQQIPNTELVALDTFRLNQFRKITRPETLRVKDVGKVYYSKINGVVEFYTMEGRHPEDPKRQLRPLSHYMFERYVMNKDDD